MHLIESYIKFGVMLSAHISKESNSHDKKDSINPRKKTKFLENIYKVDLNYHRLR